MEDLDFINASISTYQSGPFPAEATKETFKDFPMFYKITFRNKGGLPFADFTISTKDKKYTYDRKLNRWFSVTNINLIYVEVFVFKENLDNPLLVRVNNRNEYYYYKTRESEILDGCSKLKKSHRYLPSKFFEALIEENEITNHTITFRIDKITSYNSIHIEDVDYNDNILGRTHLPNETNKPLKQIVLRWRTRVEDTDISYDPDISDATDIFDYTKGIIFDRMIVYYRTRVKHSAIPLLIEFAKDNEKYYIYKKHINQEKWIGKKIDNETDLKHKIEEIEILLFYSISVSIHEKSTYTRGIINSNTNSANSGKTFEEEIKVEKKTDSKIPNYVCYEHDLRMYSKEDIKIKNASFGDNMRSLFVNIFNTLIEFINGGTETHIFFVEYRLKFYVWFYQGSGDTGEDNLPLMIQYYDRTFIPISKEEYLNKWKEIPNIIPTNQYNSKLKDQLDEVNLMLNSINLNHKVFDTSVISEYGILGSTKSHTSFNTNRIRVKYESYRKLFFKCTHTTKNGFRIGKAYYNKQVFDKKGTIKKDESVCELSNKGQTRTLRDNLTEVSIYYFIYDPVSEYPLLVEFKVSDNEYEYHVLQCDFSKFLEYKLVFLIRGDKIEDYDLHSILRHQNFIFHNIVNIKLDRKKSYTCCYKKIRDKYLEFGTKKDLGLRHCQFKGENNQSATNFPFIKVDGFNKNLLYGYNVYKHSLQTFSTDNNKGSPGYTLDQIKIEGLQIKNLDIKLNGLGFEGLTFARPPHVYVFFYRDDPRPLMMCYNNKAYVPEGINKYLREWNVVDGVSNLKLKSQDEFNNIELKLLDKLNETVGFLNTVNLYKHGRNTNHEYDVHKYNGKQISVKVTYQPLVNELNPGISTCYKKLTHTPNGINCKKAKGFRLGNIEYNRAGLIAKLDYNKQCDKWYPLTSVSVYYYDHDTEYKDPLLVELQFEDSLTVLGGIFVEYYELTCNDGRNMEWKKNQRNYHNEKYRGKELINLLDSIRYRLKKVLKIEIDKQGSYPLMLSKNPGKVNEFQKANGYIIEVEQCESFPIISNHDFKTFRHKISKIKYFDYNSIGAIAFTLNGTFPKIIEIPLNSSDGSPFVQSINYDKCKGDVDVYFYRESDDHDPVPLFIHFHEQWYMANSINDYFSKWSCVDQTQVLDKFGQLGGHEEIKKYVNKVKMSNGISGVGGLTIDIARFGSSEDIQTHPVYDLEPPYNYMENSSVELETSSDEDTEIPYDDYMENPYAYLEPPYFETQKPPDNDIEKPCVDLEIPVDNERTYFDLVIPSGNGFGAKTLEFIIPEHTDDHHRVQADQLKNEPIFKVLSVDQEYETNSELLENSEKGLETEKLGNEGSYTGQTPASLSSTGQAHGSQSDDSNQSNLGSILGGTFGSLITIGLFTFLLLKYFRKIKIRNMIPIIY